MSIFQSNVNWCRCDICIVKFEHIQHNISHINQGFHTLIYIFLANIYLFTVNNRNTRKRCEICLELTSLLLTTYVIEFVLIFLLWTLKIYHIFCSVSITDFEQVIVWLVWTLIEHKGPFWFTLKHFDKLFAVSKLSRNSTQILPWSWAQKLTLPIRRERELDEEKKSIFTLLCGASKRVLLGPFES